MAENFPKRSVLVNGLTIRNPLANYLIRKLDRPHPLILPPLPRNCERILISNISNLGDVLIATTVIPAIRDHYPNCRIGFLTSSQAFPAIELHPHVDEIHLFDHAYLTQSELGKSKAALQHIRTFGKALSEIKGKYQIGIDLQPFFPNGISLLHKAEIPTRIGYSSGGFSRFLTHPLDWKWGNEYLCSSHLNLLRSVGFVFKKNTPLPFYPKIALPPNKTIPQPYICLAPSSSRKIKEWPSNSWIALAQMLKNLGREIVLVGKGDGNRALCSSIEKSIECINFYDSLNWREFAAVIQHAELLISVDSAAIHVAASAAVPTIAIHSGINDPASWSPSGTVCSTISHKTPCSPCFNRNGCKDMTCIQLVKPEEVLIASMNYLDKTK